MSTGTSPAARPPGGAGREPGARRKTVRITVAVALLVGVVALVAGGIAWRNGQVEARSDDGRPAMSLAPIARQTLTSQVTVDGTLEFSGDYRVVNHLAGIVTGLPAPGHVIDFGEVLYAVDGAAVVLLEGAVPAYRSLTEGMSGADVVQLNAALVSLGYAGAADLDPASSEFGPATTAAFRQLQAAVGIEETGTLELGHAVFLPVPLRVTAVDATLGAPVQRGTPVLRGTGTAPVVTVALQPSLRAQLEVGDAVLVTLPDRRTVEGVVAAIGSVASVPSGGGQGGRPAIAVEVTLADGEAARTFDQAPVSVSITTAVVEDALVVPVTALMALAGGGHAVEVMHADGMREAVPVTTGLFDGSRGLVAVSGDGLDAGQQVVVPGARR